MRAGAATIAILVGLAALAGVGYALVPPYSSERPAPRVVSLEIGGESLKLPAAYLRAEPRAGDNRDSAELVMFFPELTPAARTEDVNTRTDLDDQFERIVFVSVKAADATVDPSERTARLYERFLEDTSWSHPGGLIARAFEAGSPFEGDELYYVAPEGRAFAARCRRPDQTRKTPNTCIAVFRTGRLDVDVRFSAAWLSEWEKLMAGARGLIEAARR